MTPEQRAEAVLAAVPSYVWDGRDLPVPVEDIADSVFGLWVRDVDDMTSAPGAPECPPGRSLSGLLLAGAGEIWVNAEEARRWPPRRRFTISHELGHHVLHVGGGASVFCRKASVEEDQRPPLPPQEEEANAFAAALLMPAGLVRREYARDRDFGALCRRFDTSAAAMGRRLHAAVPRRR